MRGVIATLAKLVAFDTQNPPRKIATEGGIFAYLESRLKGFELHLEDYGDGCISLLAIRGRPTVLFNFHIDTVPANPQWQRDPWLLNVEGERAYGLGACDIKGASACMLEAAQATSGDLALLFSSDEEAGRGVCIRSFLEQEQSWQGVIVSEPTLARAVYAHRGIATVSAVFGGVPGHASEARAWSDNAIHRANRWLSKVLEWAQSERTTRFENIEGVRLNTGTIQGGIKANMIAADCEISLGVRTLPGQSPESVLAQLKSMADSDELSQWTPGFLAPSFPASLDNDAVKKNKSLAQGFGLELSEPVDFWTEAALFSAAGFPAIVFGPGDIAQAHVADEWVLLEQLAQVFHSYVEMIEHA